MTETKLLNRGKRREKKGVVMSVKMAKTAIVRVDKTQLHPVYKKVITRSKKYYVHDESNSLKEGDQVTIKECRPFSKLKRWIVVTKIEETN